MDPEPGEFRDFPEPNVIVNDDVAHPFSSPIQAQTINRPLNELSEEFNSDPTFESDDMTKILSNTKIINNDNQIKEHIFVDEQDSFIEQLITNIKSFNIKNLNEKFKYLETESRRVQRITTHFENQLIAVKSIGEKLSLFCAACRSLIVSLLNIRQNTSTLTTREFEILTTYAPNSDIELPISDENLVEDYNNRLEYSRLTMNLFKKADKLRVEISTLNDVLIKSVLSKNERFNEIEQSLRLPSNIFDNNPLYEIFLYEITTTTYKQYVYIRCLRGQLTQNDIHIICTENPKHSLAQINYNASEKYSHIFDIEFKRAITSIDQVTIALPCFTLPSELQSQQQIFIRCKRIMDPLFHIPSIIETYNDVSYAVFRLTQALSGISVEAVLFYPFEILQLSNDGLYSVYTSEHSSKFRIETPKNYLIRSPRVRIIPFNSDLIRCMAALKSEDQLLASSDLIEFEWYKETKIEGIISITIQLTRHFDIFNETNEDLQKRRRKAQKKISLQRKKFEQEKYDETGGSLTPTQGLTSPTTLSHLPSIEAMPANKLQVKTPFKWKLDGFKNSNAPIILLGYKNRKWRNCNNFATITPTSDKDIYTISLTSLLDRIILIRCWPESNNEGKFDKLAENLWSLTSVKLFSCVIARDPSSINTRAHYALIIVPIQKQGLAEDILRKRNYTEYIIDEQFIYDTNSKTQLSKLTRYQSHLTLPDRSSLRSVTKYVQFCLSEGTYIRIVPMGNIDVHEKVELSCRLHAQYPIIFEFDVYPIDIYRQKTDEDFIGTLNIYQINTHNSILGSTSSLLTAATNNSSRTSSGSKDLEILDNLPINSSPRASANGPETISNIGRSGFERLTARDLNETNFICAIRIRLPKAAFQLSSTQSTTIPVIMPDIFTGFIESLTEGKQDFAEALNIHPALMNSLLISQRENYSQSSTSLYETSKMNLLKDYNTTRLENEPILKWLKRQNAFKINQTIDNIISALISIGRVDLAYMFKIENLRNK